MISTEVLKIAGKEYSFLKVDMKSAPLILLKGEVGYVMCGYLNLEVAEKLGDNAVRVTGVKDLPSLLGAAASGLTTGAKELGIKEGDRVSDILHKL